MSEVEQAMELLADIRAQLADSRRFRGYAPESVGLLGLLSLALMLLQLAWPDSFGSSDAGIVAEWALVLGAGFLAILLEAAVRSFRASDRMASPTLFAALRVVVPGTVMAAALPLALASSAPAALWIVPGFWQMLIGLVAFASYPQMPRAIIWPAGWYVVSGTLALLVASRTGSLSPLVVGMPFVIGHLAIAWILLERGEPPRGR